MQARGIRSSTMRSPVKAAITARNGSEGSSRRHVASLPHRKHSPSCLHGLARRSSAREQRAALCAATSVHSFSRLASAEHQHLAHGRLAREQRAYPFGRVYPFGQGALRGARRSARPLSPAGSRADAGLPPCRRVHSRAAPAAAFAWCLRRPGGRRRGARGRRTPHERTPAPTCRG
mgnify:CR=1 FL=1